MKSKGFHIVALTMVLVAFAPIKEIIVNVKTDISYVHTDNLQNTYVVHKDNSISKINKEGVSKATVNFKSFGDLTHLDATNPFMIYLFYRNQNALLITDNFLNLRSTIKLDALESDFITTLCRSVDDGIWIFDLNDYQLKKYDQNLTLQQSSGNVMQWLDSEPDFNFAVAEGNYVYLNSPSSGVLVFDQFANYYKRIPLQGLQYFQVFENQLYYQDDHRFMRYQPKFLKYDTLYRSTQDSVTLVGNSQLIVEHDQKRMKLNVTTTP